MPAKKRNVQTKTPGEEPKQEVPAQKSEEPTEAEEKVATESEESTEVETPEEQAPPEAVQEDVPQATDEPVKQSTPEPSPPEYKPPSPEKRDASELPDASEIDPNKIKRSVLTKQGYVVPTTFGKPPIK